MSKTVIATAYTGDKLVKSEAEWKALLTKE